MTLTKEEKEALMFLIHWTEDRVLELRDSFEEMERSRESDGNLGTILRDKYIPTLKNLYQKLKIDKE